MGVLCPGAHQDGKRRWFRSGLHIYQLRLPAAKLAQQAAFFPPLPMPAFPAEHGVGKKNTLMVKRRREGKRKERRTGNLQHYSLAFDVYEPAVTAATITAEGFWALGATLLPLRFTEKKLVSRSRASRSSVVSVSCPEYTNHCRLDGPPFGGRFFFSPPWLKLLQAEAEEVLCHGAACLLNCDISLRSAVRLAGVQRRLTRRTLRLLLANRRHGGNPYPLSGGSEDADWLRPHLSSIAEMP
ncbi:hypothetical protein TEQG_02501 [Trichophyton equinum CBS 127.97]|uniref:Uncharacterized protein n=1 Tax=Trichophyton equinum (strain ATCC MYA-4606 / CBS 127.97) TaxID=559882 RepID=F2PNK2_TRIEC|nr:hypothetical protein TEQG_02501 [Trichophyton equinum CBS 127.97]